MLHQPYVQNMDRLELSECNSTLSSKFYLHTGNQGNTHFIILIRQQHTYLSDSLSTYMVSFSMAGIITMQYNVSVFNIHAFIGYY